ncbi:hypothetical protein EMWEY_00058960, partial [Eimeria maxima]
VAATGVFVAGEKKNKTRRFAFCVVLWLMLLVQLSLEAAVNDGNWILYRHGCGMGCASPPRVEVICDSSCLFQVVVSVLIGLSLMLTGLRRKCVGRIVVEIVGAQKKCWENKETCGRCGAVEVRAAER